MRSLWCLCVSTNFFVFYAVRVVSKERILPRTSYDIPSFPSALQLRVSFGLLKNQPPFFSTSEAHYLVSEQFSFYGVRLLASRPTPKLEDQGIPLRLAPTP
jgi:hypothetical protein